MAKTWENFFTLVQPHVSGCPEVVIENHLRQASVDFCERSEVWRRRLETDYTIQGVSDYELSVPNNALLENITSLFIDGLPARRVSDFNIENYPDTAEGRPQYFSMHEDAEVRLYPTPDARYSLKTDCVLKPGLEATGVEDFIFRTHRQCIAYGALGTLMIIPGKEWTNPELATYYSLKFNKSCDDAKGRDNRRSGMRVRYRNFA